MAHSFDVPLTLALSHAGAQPEFVEQLRLFERQAQVICGKENVVGGLTRFTKDAHPGLVIDATLLEDLEVMEHARAVAKHGPLVVISNTSDAQMRFLSVMVHATMFAPAPFDLLSIVEHVEMAQARRDKPPGRVYFLEDDLAMQDVHRLFLEEKMLEAQFFSSPSAFFEALELQSPDLFVLDVELKGSRFDGLDVAKALRMDSRYLSVPILLLSGYVEDARFFRALEHGCDLILHKPIDLDHLHTAMVSRIRRFGTLSDQIMHDGLTRLYNHTHFKGHLLTLLAQSIRHGHPLSLAMIDIDKFKHVNDTCGHQTGDRIIVGLAKLLRRRLRRSDVIGRYGGDEFGVLFPNTNAQEAFQVLEEIRKDFSELHFDAMGSSKPVTFSGGIAQASPDYATEVSLTRAADIALYRAKHRGRDRIVVAQ